MGIARFVVWVTFSVVLATVFPWQKSPSMSAAQDTTLSGAASSLYTAAGDTYTEVAAIKAQEYEVLKMTLGLIINLLGRSINGVGTTLDLANVGLGAARSYTETGAGFVVDNTQTGLNSISTAVTSAGNSVKGYGSGLLTPAARA